MTVTNSPAEDREWKIEKHKTWKKQGRISLTTRPAMVDTEVISWNGSRREIRLGKYRFATETEFYRAVATQPFFNRTATAIQQNEMVSVVSLCFIKCVIGPVQNCSQKTFDLFIGKPEIVCRLPADRKIAFSISPAKLINGGTFRENYL